MFSAKRSIITTVLLDDENKDMEKQRRQRPSDEHTAAHRLHYKSCEIQETRR